MKFNPFILIAFFVALFCQSCQKIDEGQHNLEYNVTLEIPAGLSALPTHGFTWIVNSSWQNFLSVNNIDPAKVTRIRPKHFRLSAGLGNAISYEFVERAEVFIQFPRDPSSSLPIAEVAPSINEPVRDLVFLAGLADVKEYVTRDQFEIILELNFRQTTQSNTDHLLTFQFDIYVE
ncbi:MAG: hypothetical protein M3Q56_04865 [Bacteroidota bacterium]|nr:hypothetical protein [Bacteroidota bacterium]